MKRFTVTGMSCAACSARVEKAVADLPEVDSVSVNLLLGTMQVEGKVSDETVIRAVEAAGYGAFAETAGAGISGDAETADASRSEAETASGKKPLAEAQKLTRRLILSIIVLLPLMWLSMGAMLGLPLPKLFSDKPLGKALAEAALALILCIINRRFFISGTKAAFKLAPNMDTLVSLGAAASYLYSAVLTVLAAVHPEQAAERLSHLYYESAGMILTLITVGKLLEAVSKGRTTDALSSLIRLMPEEAQLLQNGTERTVPASSLNVGDIVAVRPGEAFPADAVVLKGHSSANEAALTGESLPVDKAPGDEVSAATVNQNGYLECRVTRVGSETTLSRIIRLVSDAAAGKAPIAKLADKVAGVFVPVVIVIALVTLIIWLLLGREIGFALARAVSVLVISCPCSLGLATPVAIMVGSGIGAKNGILFKTAEALEQCGKAKTVVLDKTGTLTKGEPEVAGVFPADGIGEDELLTSALSLEEKSEHPLAAAVVRYARSRGLVPYEVTNPLAYPGAGLSAACADGTLLVGGNAEMVPEASKMALEALEAARTGKSTLFFKKGDYLLGMLTVADSLKEDSPSALQTLKAMKLRTVMLTGDNEATAQAVASALAVDEVISSVKPDQKDEVIRRLSENGPVIMVGDGINDAVALTRASTGIAIGCGTDIAIDAADVVLMKSSVSDVPAAIRLSRKTLLNIKENLFWAFCYNAICIPLAAGAFSSVLGFLLDPIWAAAAMSLSSFIVVMNALRLNLVRLYPRASAAEARVTESDINEGDKPENDNLKADLMSELKGEFPMTKTLLIEGMMCPHCEAHVKKALEALPGVESAVPSHTEGRAIVTLTEAVADELLIQAVTEEGYQVTGIG